MFYSQGVGVSCAARVLTHRVRTEVIARSN